MKGENNYDDLPAHRSDEKGSDCRTSNELIGNRPKRGRRKRQAVGGQVKFIVYIHLAFVRTISLLVCRYNTESKIKKN